MVWRLGLVFLAAVAALAPIPAEIVERTYSDGVYPGLQRALTALSNRTSVALFDVVCAGVLLVWIGLLIGDVRVGRRTGWVRAAGRAAARTIVLASAIYLTFLLTWGLNYRRPSLGSRLGLDLAHATPAAASALALTAVERLNLLHGAAHATARSDGSVDPRLADAFDAARRLLGANAPIRPARPKHTWLDAYFRAAGVDGMTAPFFAEILVPSDLLDVERPAIVAHEWGHLAGFADEGEANFVAWLACLQGHALMEYSGWLSIYGDALRVLPRAERDRIAAGLEPGPLADLRAMAERRRRNLNPSVSRAGWRAYDGYLRANRVESGTASYGEVLPLVLGTELGRRAWQN